MGSNGREAKKKEKNILYQLYFMIVSKKKSYFNDRKHHENTKTNTLMEL